MQIPLRYAYIFGCLILAVFWLLIFLIRKDLRREMIWASLLGLPFGIIEFFFVPHYWNPESLFDLMRKFGFGIEGFIYSFSIAGIAAAGYEFLRNKKLKKIPRDKKLHLAPFILFVFVFLLLKFIFPVKPMLDLTAAFLAGAFLTAVLRPDLLRQIIGGGMIFGVFYFLVFSFLNRISGDVVQNFYAPQILGNFKLMGVPLEETIGAFAGGAFWSTIYEYTKAYRQK